MNRKRRPPPLSEPDEAMRSQQFGRASTILQERFDAAVAEEVRAYDSFTNEPTAEQLLALVERQAARLLKL